MKTKELVEYLSKFDPDEEIGYLILDLSSRKGFKVDAYQLLSDAGFPVLVFELGESFPMDDVAELVEEE